MTGLSVILPAFNEEAWIGTTLSEVAGYLDGKMEHEIIVINDGSTDRTLEKAERAAAEFPSVRIFDHRQNRGKGERIREGIAAAKYPHCLFMDADNSTSIREWEKFNPLFQNGADAVVASRHLPQSRIMHPQPLMRRLLGTGYRVLCRIFFGLRASDLNCGFKAYKTEVAQRLYSQTRMSDWTFDVEAFCLMKKYGVSYKEVPVRWAHKQKSSRDDFFGAVRTACGALKSLSQLKKRF